ncbi:MAG: hypothetical protein RL748_2794 [Pseudomonadota bacterium]|jgi:hemolysin III
MYHGEKFNSISHLAGALLALAGTLLLLWQAVYSGDPWRIVSFSVYGASLILLYTASTLYHSTRGARKDWLRKWDHCAIYLLIAGTYTPFTLVTLRGPWGWSLFGIAWALALIGIVQELWLAKGRRSWSLIIYVAMGWLALVAIKPLWLALGWGGFGLLACGGVLYTLGIIFYATDHKVKHGHGIWHLFVLGGSGCHYFSVLMFVA